LNISYGLPSDGDFPVARFLNIWKAQVNDQYQVHQRNGLHSPGVFLTCEGEGVFRDLSSGAIHRLAAGTFFVVDQGVPCRYACPEGGVWKFYFLHFSGLDMLKNLQLPIGVMCGTQTLVYTAKLCERMIQTLILQPFGYEHSIQGLFQDIILALAQEQAHSTNPVDEGLSRVLYWMHRHIDKPSVIDDWLVLSGMSRRKFFQAFKLHTGMTPVSYHMRLKLEAAKLALQSTKQNVRQIALSLHFCDEFHFTKLFKNEYGIPPTAYRARYSHITREG
jgi:AraC-like DNA-binding protein